MAVMSPMAVVISIVFFYGSFLAWNSSKPIGTWFLMAGLVYLGIIQWLPPLLLFIFSLVYLALSFYTLWFGLKLIWKGM